MRSGMMWQLFAKAIGSRANGFFRMISKVLSLTALISLSWLAMRWPMPSRFIQRVSEAMQSWLRTGTPSVNISPSRRVRRQVSLLSEVVAPASIWSWGVRLSSKFHSWSHTMWAWLAATMVVVQTGSGLARLAWGTNFSVRLAAWLMAGRGSPREPATPMATAPVRSLLRRIFCCLLDAAPIGGGPA